MRSLEKVLYFVSDVHVLNRNPKNPGFSLIYLVYSFVFDVNRKKEFNTLLTLPFV